MRTSEVRCQRAEKRAVLAIGELNNVTDADFGSQSMKSKPLTSAAQSNSVKSGGCQSYSTVLA